MFLSLAICPLNTNILLVGLGGGYIPRLFQNYLPTKNLTVAEIDPMVVDVCSSFFFFKPGKNVKLVVSDGLQYIASSPEAHFDQIWMDAFNGEYIPEHLATEEFLEICKLHLKPGGLLVQNLHMTKQERYRSQLILTNKVFQELPLVFNGFRCANSVIMSFNSPSGKNIVTEKLIKKRIQEFIPNVGPYNLHKEADKITRFPTLPREK
jgi:spermidine synthase